jgi:hypothetical protein
MIKSANTLPGTTAYRCLNGPTVQAWSTWVVAFWSRGDDSVPVYYQHPLYCPWTTASRLGIGIRGRSVQNDTLVESRL